MTTTFPNMFVITSLVLIITCSSASEFLWSTWGGTVENQQRTPDTTDIFINENNIDSMQEICKYTSINGIMNYGFTTVYISNDGQYNGVFSDFSGNIININLDTCIPNWIVNITEVLDEDREYVTRNGLSLFTDPSTGNEGVIFATPNGGDVLFAETMKYAVALHLNTGGLMWKLPIGNGIYEEAGTIHAMAVDPNNQYAYFGMSSACNDIGLTPICKFIGRFVKIRISPNPEIVDIWYTIPQNKWPDSNAPYDRNYYQGASSWNWPALIDNYVVFGTGNLYSMPDHILSCMTGGTVPSNNYPFDPCGIDQSDTYPQWRCLEDDIYPSSFNILKTFVSQQDQSFEHITSIRLQGTDVFASFGENCLLDVEPYIAWNNEICYPIVAAGADADLAAVAAYRYNNGLYTAAVSKGGMFYSFEIPSGRLILSKKIGPWSALGGGQFSIAVDQNRMIAIVHITGGTGVYYTRLSDDVAYCGGSIHGINLINGRTLYEIPNPWANFGDICEAQTFGDTGISLGNYTDYSTINSDICSIGEEDIGNVVRHINISDIENVNRTIDVVNKASFFAPVTISNDLLYIPSATGDIFIVDLIDGQHVYTLRCEYHTPTPNLPALGTRRGIRGGVTVVEDRIIYYCGDVGNLGSGLVDGIVHSLKLPQRNRGK